MSSANAESRIGFILPDYYHRIRWRLSMGESIVDVGELLKILRAIADGQWYNVSDIVKRAKVSYATMSKYLPIMQMYRLVEVRSEGRAKYVKITDKGLQAVVLAERLMNLLFSP